MITHMRTKNINMLAKNAKDLLSNTTPAKLLVSKAFSLCVFTRIIRILYRNAKNTKPKIHSVRLRIIYHPINSIEVKKKTDQQQSSNISNKFKELKQFLMFSVCFTCFLSKTPKHMRVEMGEREKKRKQQKSAFFVMKSASKLGRSFKKIGEKSNEIASISNGNIQTKA